MISAVPFISIGLIDTLPSEIVPCEVETVIPSESTNIISVPELLKETDWVPPCNWNSLDIKLSIGVLNCKSQLSNKLDTPLGLIFLYNFNVV